MDYFDWVHECFLGIRLGVYQSFNGAQQQSERQFSSEILQYNSTLQTFRHNRRRWRLSNCRCGGGKLFCRPACLKPHLCSRRIWSETDPQKITRGSNSGWPASAAKLSNHRASSRRTVPDKDIIILANRVVFKSKRFKSKHNFIARLRFYHPRADFIHRVVVWVVWCLYGAASLFKKSTTIIWKRTCRYGPFSLNLSRS